MCWGKWTCLVSKKKKKNLSWDNLSAPLLRFQRRAARKLFIWGCTFMEYSFWCAGQWILWLCWAVFVRFTVSIRHRQNLPKSESNFQKISNTCQPSLGRSPDKHLYSRELSESRTWLRSLLWLEATSGVNGHNPHRFSQKSYLPAALSHSQLIWCEMW